MTNLVVFLTCLCLTLQQPAVPRPLGHRLIVVGLQGERTELRDGSLGCGCADPTHGGKTTPADIAASERVVFLEKPMRYTLVLPFEIIDKLSIRRKAASRGNSKERIAQVILTDGHTEEGVLLNHGPVSGEVGGRIISISLERVETMTVVESSGQAHLPVELPAHQAELVVRALPRRETVRLSNVGLMQRNPCANKCCVPKAGGELLETEGAPAIHLGDIETLYTLASSVSRERRKFLRVKLRNGNELRIRPQVGDGLLAIGSIGRFDVPIELNFDDFFRIDFGARVTKKGDPKRGRGTRKGRIEERGQSKKGDKLTGSDQTS